jgi:uncharacterized repeat protein (TIGR03803 family)
MTFLHRAGVSLGTRTQRGLARPRFRPQSGRRSLWRFYVEHVNSGYCWSNLRCSFRICDWRSSCCRRQQREGTVRFLLRPQLHGREYPEGLIFDSSGNLYGVADGGTFGYGVILELTPGAGGTWTENVLYSFCPGGWLCNDGAYPAGNLTLDKAGNLYGMTTAGGANQTVCGGASCGTAFELSPGGTWTEVVLHSFNFDGKDGVEPLAGVTFDTAGNLYGTTLYGGAHGGGIVFELTPGSNGTWTETVLHNFCSARGCADGSALMAGVVFDKNGNLYGTTTEGGASNTCGDQRCGVVFKLKPGPAAKSGSRRCSTTSLLVGAARPDLSLMPRGTYTAQLLKRSSS